MKRNLLTIIIGAVLILVFGLLLFVFQVRQSEVAVVTTFGKPVANIDQPGEGLRSESALDSSRPLDALKGLRLNADRYRKILQ